jgi:hypothetical protein
MGAWRRSDVAQSERSSGRRSDRAKRGAEVLNGVYAGSAQSIQPMAPHKLSLRAMTKKYLQNAWAAQKTNFDSYPLRRCVNLCITAACSPTTAPTQHFSAVPKNSAAIPVRCVSKHRTALTVSESWSSNQDCPSTASALHRGLENRTRINLRSTALSQSTCKGPPSTAACSCSVRVSLQSNRILGGLVRTVRLQAVVHCRIHQHPIFSQRSLCDIAQVTVGLRLPVGLCRPERTLARTRCGTVKLVGSHPTLPP